MGAPELLPSDERVGHNYLLVLRHVCVCVCARRQFGRQMEDSLSEGNTGDLKAF